MDKKAEATPQTEEEKKLAERAKKFGTDKVKNEAVVKEIVDTLNGGLSETAGKGGKRRREERGGGDSRQAKRQTPDRRTEGARRGGRGEARGAGGGGAFKKITDDPAEAAKAEARAKRFATAAK